MFLLYILILSRGSSSRANDRLLDFYMSYNVFFTSGIIDLVENLYKKIIFSIF